MIKVPGDAAATVVLAGALIVGLFVRDELPAPPTPTPPRFVLDMSGASIGGEVSDAGPFWTIDAAAAFITIVNTSTAPAAAVLSMRLADGPCSAGNVVMFSGPGFERAVKIPPGVDASLDLPTVEVPALGQTMIELDASGPPCGPVGADPRSIYFQVFTLAATG